MHLRPYQTTAVDAIRRAYLRGYRKPLLVLPTGGGKTVIFSYITRQAAEKGNTVVILLHRVELVRQTSEKLREMGVDHGVIHPQYRPQYYKNVQVASVQSLSRRLKYMSAPDLIIIDEAHHAPAGTWSKITEAWSESKCLGVTATPIRSDGKGLASSFDCLVEGSNVRELIDGGYLVQPLVYSVPSADLSGLKKRGGDYRREDAAAVMDKPKIVGDVVNHYRKLADGLPAVAFCVTVAHAEHVAAEFRAQGYRAMSADGSMSDAERKRVIGGLATGEVQVLCSCDLISEGTDIPAIAAAILLRPTMSEGLFLQQVGRALRPMAGKENAIIIDHVGNCRKHGLPDEIREWVLTDDKVSSRRKSQPAEVKIRVCQSCYAAFDPAPVCPVCGTECEAARTPPKQVDGELELITQVKKQRRMEVGMARTMDDLREIAKERGYKSGWVWRMAQLKGISN